MSDRPEQMDEIEPLMRADAWQIANYLEEPISRR
jgi:hypothetical protein